MVKFSRNMFSPSFWQMFLWSALKDLSPFSAGPLTKRSLVFLLPLVALHCHHHRHLPRTLSLGPVSQPLSSHGFPVRFLFSYFSLIFWILVPIKKQLETRHIYKQVIAAISGNTPTCVQYLKRKQGWVWEITYSSKVCQGPHCDLEDYSCLLETSGIAVLAIIYPKRSPWRLTMNDLFYMPQVATMW